MSIPLDFIEQKRWSLRRRNFLGPLFQVKAVDMPSFVPHMIVRFPAIFAARRQLPFIYCSVNRANAWLKAFQIWVPQYRASKCSRLTDRHSVAQFIINLISRDSTPQSRCDRNVIHGITRLHSRTAIIFSKISHSPPFTHYP
jgi:hypothetical protein